MESICRRHPLRMRSTPGVDPGFFIFTLLFFPTWYVIWGGGGEGGGKGGGAKYDCGRMCVRRASGLLHIAMSTLPFTQNLL